ncbi:hypothetical protein N338_13301, partial [Podiceps cristatus]
NTLLQHLTSRLAKRERPSNGEDKESYSPVSQQGLNSPPPASSEEWIPPSANKTLKPTVSLNLKRVMWAADFCAGRTPTSESKENGENDGCSRNERLNPGNATGILTTPGPAGVTKALVLNDTVMETCSPSEGKNLLSDANSSGGVWEGAMGWSPELLFHSRTLF